MNRSLEIIRALVIYGLTLPLAIYLGYSLAGPMTMTSFTLIALVLLLLLSPMLLRWHIPFLLLSWNTTAVVIFLPGRPDLWLVMVAVSLCISMVQRTLNRDMHFLFVPSITWPLIFLALVVVVTAQLTGGLGFRVFGSEVIGGKRYVLLLGAILGYFAISCQRIPPNRATLCAALFFLGGLSWTLSNLIEWADPSFYFIFLIFPPVSSPGMQFGMQAAYLRPIGLGFAGTAFIAFLLLRYGIKAVFDLSKPWRSLAFVGAIVIGLFGGFRSMLILWILTFCLQFYYEGLFRSRLLPLFTLLGIFTVAFLFVTVPYMPPVFQRNFAWLPVEVDPAVRMDVDGSSDWRLRMWQAVLPEVPKYVFLGKGLAMSSAELDMAPWEMRGGFQEDYYTALISANYHSGPLSVLLSFGIWGVIGFLWFIGAGVRLLYNNYRYGDESLRTVNTFLLSFFIAQTLAFIFVAGGFSGDFVRFTGLLGLSVAINGGRSRPVPAPVPEPVEVPLIRPFLSKPQPAFAK